MFGYIIFQARNIIIGPIVKIKTPINGSRLKESLIEIKGVAKNISYISMNDKQIFTDDNGVFSQKLLLFRGYNIIIIRAVDRFGRETQKKLELIY
ncbi:hypothetical protein COT82_00780 [Candidatus Campbellbacteria bacterium CG10_big_fil_rev_8_21_14_0_10_35_52]|uniref:Uncharacterized protein n=1 Tax=Candidatus Campbellbacteria bacterium CG10_big_fil_rev_8_21_14_0_10_35_52 TaxID=1974527 RepID=A0A2M6WVR2_9BACT|nr:MAG: hypothetical protein COT82_00780 [Candidatus Campbellbacteria bacterium CG10_big_fil_rev_8_21_14_0_10_35_52]